MIGIRKLCQVLNVSQYKMNQILKENNILITYPYVNPQLIKDNNADVVFANVNNGFIAKPVYRVKFIEGVIKGFIKVPPIPDEKAALIECSLYIDMKKEKMKLNVLAEITAEDC